MRIRMNGLLLFFMIGWMSIGWMSCTQDAPCPTNYCMNGGSSTKIDGDCACICPEGIYGKYCSFKSPPCLEFEYCANGFEKNPEACNCLCNYFYYGTYCDSLTIKKFEGSHKILKECPVSMDETYTIQINQQDESHQNLIVSGFFNEPDEGDMYGGLSARDTVNFGDHWIPTLGTVSAVLYMDKVGKISGELYSQSETCTFREVD